MKVREFRWYYITEREPNKNRSIVAKTISNEYHILEYMFGNWRNDRVIVEDNDIVKFVELPRD